MSLVAILASGCASYASTRADDQYAYANSQDRRYYSNEQQHDNQSTEYRRVGGIDAARDAHRRYPPYQAEQMDGDCEVRVSINRGETLSDIAQLCDVSLNAILAANPRIRNANRLAVGDQINIPRGVSNVYTGYDHLHDERGLAMQRRDDIRFDNSQAVGSSPYHVVRRGETLGRIAARYDVSLNDILQLNRNIRPDQVEVGQRIYLPGYARGLVSGQADRRLDASLGRVQPDITIFPARGPRNGEIFVIGDNFGRNQRVVVLYGDDRNNLQQIRTIETDEYGRFREAVRLPEAYQRDQAFFAVRRGEDVYMSGSPYAVDQLAEISRVQAVNQQRDRAFGYEPQQQSQQQQTAGVLRAMDREVYRSGKVTLIAEGFPGNTPISIYGGPNRNTLSKIAEIRSGPSGIFRTDVGIPANVSGDSVLYVAAVEDGARTYFTEVVRVRADERRRGEGSDLGYGNANDQYGQSDFGQYQSEQNNFDDRAGERSPSTSLNRGIQRQGFAGPALLSRFMKNGSVATGGINAGGPSAISGVLTNEGRACPALRDDAGNLYTLLGELRGFGNGDRVLIKGSSEADNRICNQSQTIQVFSIESAPW